MRKKSLPKIPKSMLIKAEIVTYKINISYNYISVLMEHKDSSKLSPIFTEEDEVELDKPYVDMFDSAADIIEFLKMNEYIPAFDYKIAEKTY